MYNHIRNIWFFDILRWIYINIKFIIYTYTMTRITNIDLIYTTIIISSCYCTWENSHIHIYNVFKIIWSSITSTRSVASFHTRIACKLLVCMMYINKSVCLFYEQRLWNLMFIIQYWKITYRALELHHVRTSSGSP